MGTQLRRWCITFLLFFVSGATALIAEQPSPLQHSKELTPHRGGAIWNLPVRLTDKNVTIHFELDSTWHTVHGSVAGVSGDASLRTPGDPSSVQLRLRFPVKRMDTDSSSRDKKMRRVMAEEQYPEVVFQAYGLRKNCTPAKVLEDGSCQDELSGELTIRDIRKKVALPILISYEQGKGFHASGKLPIGWAEYHVEDPSILIASVDPVVLVSFEVIFADSNVKPVQ